MKLNKTICVVLPVGTTHHGFYKDVLSQVQVTLVSKGYGFIIYVPCLDVPCDWALFYRNTADIVDGYLMVSPRVEDELMDQIAAGAERMSCVLLLCRSARFSSVGMDNRQAVIDAVMHLAGLGHRKIGTISGDLGTYDARERLAVFNSALASHGIARNIAYTAQGDFSRESGKKAMLKLLDLADRPSAIFCANDNMAVGAMDACREKHVVIPDDISIAGCDDILQGGVPVKPLTTIRQPLLKIAEEGTLLLLDEIEHPEHKKQDILVKGSLVTRESTGKPRS